MNFGFHKRLLFPRSASDYQRLKRNFSDVSSICYPNWGGRISINVSCSKIAGFKSWPWRATVVFKVGDYNSCFAASYSEGVGFELVLVDHVS
jgi:hypothetical protein